MASADDAFPGPLGWGRLPSLGLTVGVGHDGAPLRDGSVLLAGGEGGGGLDTPLATTELITPGRHRAQVGPMAIARAQPKLVALEDGRVLAIGPGRETELFEPITGRWAAAPPLAVDHGAGFAAARLHDGRVLVAGGRAPDAKATGSVELFDPLVGGWTDGPKLKVARDKATAVPLPDGGAVVLGGEDVDRVAQRSVERLAPGVEGGWHLVTPMPVARIAPQAVYLPTEDRVLVAGGVAAFQPPIPPFEPTYVDTSRGAVAVDLYDVTLDGWVPAARLDRVNPRLVSMSALGDRTAVASDGSVIDQYDPQLDRWLQLVRPPGAARRRATLTRFNGGRVMLSGGLGAGDAPLRDAVVLGPVARLQALSVKGTSVRFSSSVSAVVAFRLRRLSGGVVARALPKARLARRGPNSVQLLARLPLGTYRLELTPQSTDRLLTGPPVALKFRATMRELLPLVVPAR